MKKTIMKVAAVAVLIYFVSAVGYAQREPQHCIDSIPSITKEQKVQIAGIKESNRIDMDDLLKKREVATTWEEKDKLDRLILDKRIEHRNAIRNVLSEEQKKFFDKNFDKHREMRKEGKFEKKHDGRKHKGECPMQK